ncbi:hypothetical protein [Wielerella bovis]|uniref:hypothetical protein n=1 Tax=Wielerella bovis TaxID=2917790 RepID=UPI0020188A8D|nr:hypothetical protein [Wielerella bovis]ULJ61044.1 hypothetical protein MIS44_04100 [Wielerella bovis]
MNETQIAQQNTAQALANGAFFDYVRKNLFSGSLNQSQVDGINALVLAGVEHGLTVQQLAYVLATSYHETGIPKILPNGNRVMTRPMQPVPESGKGAGRKYGTWQTNSAGVKYCPKHGGSNAPVYTETECPHLLYGRGHVQLTWYANYERATREINKTLPENEHIDLIKNPDLALDLAISCKVIVLGMAQGWFTGKKLSDYINNHRDDYVNARRIVNGTDKAEQIARYARVFETALNAV